MTKRDRTGKKQEVVVASFPSGDHAWAALFALHNAGFPSANIGIMCRDDAGGTHYKSYSELDGNYERKAAAIGAAVGASGGAGWTLGVAAGLLPALGPIVAGGLFGALLVSSSVGAATGGVVGALIGIGIDEEQAAYVEREMHRGRTVVAVKGNAAKALEILSVHEGTFAAPRKSVERLQSKSSEV